MKTDSAFFLGGKRSQGDRWAQWRSRKAAGLGLRENVLTAAGQEPAETYTWEPRAEAKVSFSVYGCELYNTDE